MAVNRLRAAAALAVGALALAAAQPAWAQVSVADDVRAGELEVPINKSQVLRTDRAYSKAMVGNPEIADVLPMTNQSLYVLGKKTGTTSLTIYDRGNRLMAVVDVVVGPDVMTLKRQLSDLMPSNRIGARTSNGSVVLEGIVSNAVEADRAVQLAETYAPGKVVNLLSLGSAQQVMLEVRFAEVKRSAVKQLGVSWFVGSDEGNFGGVTGGDARQVVSPEADGDNLPGILQRGEILGSFGILSRTFRALGENFNVTLDALERKGAITTLAEPTLVALSGETASFLAGGEFPVPIVQGSNANSASITVEWKPFGVSLAFTPTVLADGVINMIVQPEVSSIDPTNVIVVSNQRIPGLLTRRAKTVVEIRDGESFALAGLLRKDFQDTIRQVPLLGSLPIIGTLFRSSGFQNEETELVIIVTPRLVRPVRAGSLKVPTDRAGPPSEADILLNGRTDTGVPSPGTPTPLPPNPQYYPGQAPAGPGGGMAKAAPSGFEKDYGHVL